jgi:nucleoside-diphosphate-sugar epimerase
MQTSKILLTGANGFVGRAILKRVRAEGVPVCAVVRGDEVPPGCVRGPALGAAAGWAPLLAGCNTMVHAAARVHVMDEKAHDPLAAFREVNVAGTLNLARQAAEAGIRRFVFISTIKVNGEATASGRAFTSADTPAPMDAYAISKAEAEAGLISLAAGTGMEVVIVRPPLVYGPGVKANFLSMMRWLKRGIPLPLGAILHNRRSLVTLDNLVDLILACIDHPAAANQVFLASDGEDVSTTDLLRRLAAAMGVPAHLLPVPVRVLETCAALVGKRSLVKRLCNNLQVDISKARQLLGWCPPISLNEGLRRTVAGTTGPAGTPWPNG